MSAPRRWLERLDPRGLWEHWLRPDWALHAWLHNSWLRRYGYVLTYGLLLLVVAFTDSARHWQLQLRPSAAADRARELAVEMLPEAADWDASVRGLSRDAELEQLLIAVRRRDGELPAGLRRWSPLRFEVQLDEPDGASRLRFVLSGDGQALEIDRLPRGAFEELAPGELQTLAEALLDRVTDRITDRITDAEPQWLLVPEPDDDSRIPGRFTWRRDLAPGLEQVATIEVRRGRADRLRLELEATDDLVKTIPEAEHIDGGIAVVVTILALGVLLWQAFNYRLAWFGALMLGLWVTLTLLMSGPLGPIQPVQQVATAFLVLAAGYVSLRKMSAPRAESLELLLRGRVTARPVGSAVYGGLRWGGLFGLAAYLPAVLDLPLRPVATDALVAANSGLGPILLLLPRVSLGLLVIFAFLLPWLAGWLPRRLSQLVALAFGGLLLALELGAEGAVGLQWLAGLLLAVTALVLFRHRDLLAVLAAGFGASVAICAGALLLQPARRIDSLLMLAGLVGFTLLARRSKRYGRPLSLAPRLLAPQPRLSAQRDLLERELSLAREAQMHMLPPAPPSLSGYNIAALCRPARDVGGDLYDFVPVPGGLGLAVGDVSGKGMVASLYMTLTKGLLLAASEHCSSVAEALCEMHRGIHASVDRKTFVTLWYGWLDLETRQLEYARAGHNPVLWRRVSERATASLAAPGLALGSTKPPLFERILRSATVELASGDALFLYSDGLPEAMNEAGEEYGEERLVGAVERTDGLDAEQALNVVMADVVAFAGDAAQHDDMTLVVVRVE